MVVPVATHTDAPFSSLADFTPSFLGTISPWPSTYMMPTNDRPMALSRLMVHVVVRERMSTSPDCSAVKRSLAVSGLKDDLRGVAEHGRRDGAAEIDVEAGPVALVVGEGEARRAGADAAVDHAAALDGRQRTRAWASGGADRAERAAPPPAARATFRIGFISYALPCFIADTDCSRCAAVSG